MLGRDLYDLTHFASRTIDEALVRRLRVLKVWGDVVDDHRGHKPLDPNDVLQARTEQDQPGSIGVLTQPVDIATRERRVRTRFEFLRALDDDELRRANVRGSRRGRNPAVETSPVTAGRAHPPWYLRGRDDSCTI